MPPSPPESEATRLAGPGQTARFSTSKRAKPFEAEGEVAAYGWLLGDPVSPQRRLAIEANDETMIAEYQAADAEFQAGEARFVERGNRGGPDRFDIDEALCYAAGVRHALFWALSRNRPTAVAN